MARLKLNLWDSVISDCKACLEFSPDNMKAYYYLSQAELELDDYIEALDNARRAHELCVTSGDKSLSSITAQVLRCKKRRWDVMEKHRVREAGELESAVLGLMEKERDAALKEAADQDEGTHSEIAAEWENKMTQMKGIFEKARDAEDKKRNVPDWAIDDISFAIMIDPVIVSPCEPLASFILLRNSFVASSSLPSITALTLARRPRRASPTSGLPSWNTYGSTRPIPSPETPCIPRSCGRTWA